jgi:hypothetical protein
MNLADRLQELDLLRKNGNITDEEFLALVSQATESETSNVTPNEKNAFKGVSKKNQITIGVLLTGTAIVIAAVVLSRPGNPVESDDYKKLLEKRSTLLATKNDLTKKSKNATDLQAEVSLYEEKVKSNYLRLADVKELDK